MNDLAFGNWTAPALSLGIHFQEQITITEVTFKSTLCELMKGSWINIVRAVWAQEKIAYARDLCGKGYSIFKCTSYLK